MTRRRAVRMTAVAVAAILVGVAVLVGGGATVLIRRPLPERGGDVELAGMTGSASVLRDAQGVPQIYADNALDLFRVQGFVHAEDRFFEMDLRRHITAGRLSELVGKDTDALRADALIRTMGWRRVAEQELPLLSATTRSYLQAYADGVNAYIKDRSPSQLSVSYTILERKVDLPEIEPWTPVDSLAWLKAMAWDLRSNYSDELARARAISTVRDLKRVNQLFPEYPYQEHEPIVQGAVSRSSSLVNQALTSEAGESGAVGGSNATEPALAPPPAGSSLPLSELEAGGAQDALVAADKAVDAVPDLLGAGEGLGSNSWVVGGRLTESGAPMLANDPHLKVSMPGVWVQGGLHCNTVDKACPFDVAGFSFAGMPGVVIGHNNRISWGMTNLAPDVTDFYLERISGATVEYDDKQVPLTTRQETIKVSGSEPVTITVRSTRHGPVISDVLDSLGQAGRSAPVASPSATESPSAGTSPSPSPSPSAATSPSSSAGDDDDRDSAYSVALDWTALTPGRSMDAVFDLNRATDFASFRKAVVKLEAPGQNFVYADVDGHIGYQASGKVPIRGPGRSNSPVPVDGTWPHPGWDPAYDWTGYVDTAKLPWVEDPPDNYIVAANQAVTGPDGPVTLTQDWDYGFRSDRIQDLLVEAAKRPTRLTVEDMQEVQRDTRNEIAAELVPLLLKTETSTTDSFTREGIDLLKGWDFTQPTDSPAAAYFNVVWTNILDLAFADELPEGFRPDGGNRWFEVVSTLLSSRRSPWWDDRRTPDVIENRDEVLRRSLSQARLQLTAALGKDPKRWQWGRLHRLQLTQTPLGGSAPSFIKRLVNRGPYAAPGGSSIVNAFAWDAASGSFDVTAAPSMRMVVDLGDLDRSRWVNQTGVSGHPGDKHYDDQIDTWLAGNDYAWPAGVEAIRRASDDEQKFSSGQ